MVQQFPGSIALGLILVAAGVGAFVLSHVTGLGARASTAAAVAAVAGGLGAGDGDEFRPVSSGRRVGDVGW